jgi:hypothetical protein
MPTDDDVDDDRPAPNVAMPNPRGPVFNTFPQPQVVNPQMPMPNGMAPGQQMAPQQVPVQQAPTAYPTMPNGGVAVPGMVVQPPQQPGQVPGQPGAMPIPPQNQTGQPIRRPGGADFDEDR